MASHTDPDAYTTPFQLTKGIRRDVYGSIDPSNPDLNVKDKVLVISGASSGLGHVRGPKSPNRDAPLTRGRKLLMRGPPLGLLV